MNLIKLDENLNRVWTGQPCDLRQVLPEYGRPEALTADELASMGIYLLEPDQLLPEGARVDSETFAVSNNIAVQTVTHWTTAQELIIEAQAARHAQVVKMATDYGDLVSTLSLLVQSIGLSIPCTRDDVKTALLAIPSMQRPTGLMGDFDAVYGACREVMSDDDIAAVWSIIQGV